MLMMAKFSRYVIPLIFVGTFGFFIAIYILSIWNETAIPPWSKIADGFSIGGVFLASYVALWAYQSEIRRINHDQQENEYYKINIINNLLTIATNLEFVIPNDFWQQPSLVQERLGVEIVQNVRVHNPSVIQTCSDMQILNTNSFIPPDVKNHVGIIIRVSRSIFSMTDEGIQGFDIIVIIPQLIEYMENLLHFDYFDLLRILEERE